MRAVAGSVWHEVNRNDSSVGPVQNVQRSLIPRREIAVGSKLDRRWRALTDVTNCNGIVGSVGKIWRPLAGHTAPAIVGSAHEMQNTGGPIPRRAHVELGVGIVGERFAVIRMKRHAKRIAQPGANQFPLLRG